MDKCWASIIGGCSDTLSGEHYVSRGLWQGRPLVLVSGFDWLSGEEKVIPTNRLIGKMLCTNHNNQLSPLDSEAVEFIRTLAEFERVLFVRWKTRQKSILNIKRYTVDGIVFERWAVKTAIGCSVVNHKDKLWHQTQRSIRHPPGEIVRAVYGFNCLSKPMGLYFARAEEDTDFFQDGISIETLFHPEGGLVGALLRFRGFRFLVWLTEVSLESFDVRDSKGNSVDVEQLLQSGTYRPGDYWFKVGKALSHVLKFKW